MSGKLSINERHLVALLRREGHYSGAWFADKLLDAANLIERLAAETKATPPIDQSRGEG